MKKIYLLTAVSLLITAISVNAQGVSLQMHRNYEVRIDNRHYSGNQWVNNLGYGRHMLKVYEVKPGFLGIGRKKILISTSYFNLRNFDVSIQVDRYGRMNIFQAGSYGRNDGKYGNGKGYGPYNNPGRGNKYGLYKKHKHERDDWDDHEARGDRD